MTKRTCELCRLLCLGFLLPVSLSGCSLLTINDPNKNDKIRYSMAHKHAKAVIKETGSLLRPYSPDYELEIFWRRHYEKQTGVLHDYQLYDFLKTSREPGPDRFVIAYDTATRQTYLRSDLRSNKNIDRLPVSSCPYPGMDSPR